MPFWNIGDCVVEQLLQIAQSLKICVSCSPPRATDFVFKVMRWGTWARSSFQWLIGCGKSLLGMGMNLITSLSLSKKSPISWFVSWVFSHRRLCSLYQHSHTMMMNLCVQSSVKSTAGRQQKGVSFHILPVGSLADPCVKQDARLDGP